MLWLWRGVDEDSLQCASRFRASVNAVSCQATGSLGYFMFHGMVVRSDYYGSYLLLKTNEKGFFSTKQSMAVCVENKICKDRDRVEAFQLYSQFFQSGFLITAI